MGWAVCGCGAGQTLGLLCVQGDSSSDFLPADAGVGRAQGAVLGSKNSHTLDMEMSLEWKQVEEEIRSLWGSGTG